MGDVSGFRKSDTPGGRCGKPMPRVGQPRQVYLYRSIFLLKSNVDIVLYRRGVDLMDYNRANKTITFNGYYDETFRIY